MLAGSPLVACPGGSYGGRRFPDDPILLTSADNLYAELQTMSRHRLYQERGFFSLGEVKGACRRVIEASRNPEKLDSWSLIRVLVTRMDIDEIPTKFYERTKFKLHDDEMDIRNAGNLLRQKTRGSDFLQSVEALQNALASIWESSSIYLYDSGSNTMRLVQRTVGGYSSFSPYQQDWSEPKGLYAEVLKRAKEGEDVCVWDITGSLIKQENWVSPDAVENDSRVFYLERGNPGKIATLVIRANGQIVAIVNVSNRVLRQAEPDKRLRNYPALSYRPPFNERSLKTAIETLKGEILGPAANKIAEGLEGQSILEKAEKHKRELGLHRLFFNASSLPSVQMPRYLEGVRPVRIKRSSFDREVKIALEIVKDPGKALRHIRNQVVADLLEMFKLAWIPVVTASPENLDKQRMEEYLAKKCLDSADKLIIVRDEKTGEKLGFATITEEYHNGKPFYALGLTSLDPRLQNMRLSVLINKILIAEAWRENKHKFPDGRIPIIVRTATPKLLGALVEGLEEVWPNPFMVEEGTLTPTGEPAHLFAEAAEAISKQWSGETTFDQRTFVSYGALKETFGFTFIPEEIQWHRDERVNAFCRQHLGNPEEGNAFIIMGYVSGAALRRSVWRDLKYRMGKRWISLRNLVVRKVSL
ncbi:hypothetical protein A2276_01450 [candidate division WOR-1 bacterium RIFOXYA12_FULL_43_27]|uniref:Uncharacterized protein n=1 Tax=candidate division WOR-1 bacterium RIFOXYC2_FULL_46_14 TaxID=1802587 RepID=A0A1F4U4X2_UNCSA|nr:MAG: hypothetical protein A2276_01450 [candidate division WOR-1 bacterium RIFOXYA12_FULL_43_27]OGC20650.1 MAG: hypothetical protein A2292_06425 [candidate division WOR-1 bacterium RIFOXYB2_FULL_46_45]OGC31613.1 MAG: hypothetical protein A2232_05025 [candidate division WOR-1 bacterium RIFOXYA2_FULL_46_56]OGC40018.1 MAG: hypothetical protein A2438_05870 [candidate division WOR-1 bacterium RIFOXYC2_FULL_46_14]